MLIFDFLILRLIRSATIIAQVIHVCLDYITIRMLGFVIKHNLVFMYSYRLNMLHYAKNY